MMLRILVEEYILPNIGYCKTQKVEYAIPHTGDYRYH